MPAAIRLANVIAPATKRGYGEDMDKKRASETGIRVELPHGTDEAVAIDELVYDMLTGDYKGALHTLREPHEGDHPGHDGSVRKPE